MFLKNNSELNNMSEDDQKKYNMLIAEYNKIVNTINETKKKINEYDNMLDVYKENLSIFAKNTHKNDQKGINLIKYAQSQIDLMDKQTQALKEQYMLLIEEKRKLDQFIKIYQDR